MKKEHFFYLVIVVLILLNATISGMLWYSNIDFNKQRKQDNEIVSRLNLDPKQQEAYRRLTMFYKKAIEDIDSDQRKKQVLYFELLKQEQPDIRTKKSLEFDGAELSRKKDSVTFLYLRRFRSICNASQKKMFDQMTSLSPLDVKNYFVKDAVSNSR